MSIWRNWAQTGFDEEAIQNSSEGGAHDDKDGNGDGTKCDGNVTEGAAAETSAEGADVEAGSNAMTESGWINAAGSGDDRTADGEQMRRQAAALERRLHTNSLHHSGRSRSGAPTSVTSSSESSSW